MLAGIKSHRILAALAVATLAAPALGQVVTNASGVYQLLVPNGWSGTVTPQHANYSFTPSERDYVAVTVNQTGQNYTAAVGDSSILIAIGANWRYLKGLPGMPPSNWTQRTFSDSNWLIGPTGIGYGDGDDATVLTDMEGNYLTVYTRKAFSIINPRAISALTLQIDYDDGFVAYINGIEIARRGLGAPGTPVDANTPADNHEAGTPEIVPFTVPPGLLVSGSNALAIEIHNTDINSSDLSLIPELLQGAAPLPNIPPTAVLSATPLSGTPPLPVSFNATGSIDPDGTIVSYSWNFGDNTSVTSGALPTAAHVYSNTGAYVATVTVTDNGGLTAQAAIAITVGAVAANTIYVDGTIGVGSCTTYNPTSRTCGSGTAIAYNSLSGAAAAALAGNTVMIRGGTYTQQLVPLNSGTVVQPITFRNYPSEIVTLTGSFGYLINLSGRQYLILDGLNVDNTGWLEADNAHFNVIRNCSFTHTPASGTTGNLRFVQSNRNQIYNNYVEDGNDNLVLIDSNYNLVYGNTVMKARHSIWGIRCGDYNVIRGNYFHNDDQKIGEVYDCGVDTTAVPHQFDSTTHNVIENNTFAKTKAASNYYSYNGIQYAGQYGLIRRNVFYDNLGGGLDVTLYADEALHDKHNRVYHNVFYDNDCHGLHVSDGAGQDMNDNLIRNNILFFNQGCDAAGMTQVWTHGMVGFDVRFNDILYQQAGQAVLVLPAGTQALAQAQTNYPAVFSSNSEAAPAFVNPIAHDFHLASGSPMIDAGAFLTQTVGAGSGTIMVVQDAQNFFDGFGIPIGGTNLPDANGDGLLDGDVIQLQGQVQTARIVSVNYATNTLTLATPLTWISGQNISLAYQGAAPDMGAAEFGAP